MSNMETSHDHSPGLVGLVLIILQLFFGAMVLILAAAFVMGLLGANPDAQFASWIYERTTSIMRPFDGIFSPITVSDKTEINTSLLFAILVYSVIAGAIGGIARRF